MGTVVALWCWVPSQPADTTASMASELGSLRRAQVWLALLIGTVGFGGMFATYSYIAPTMTGLAGFSAATVPVILAVYGCGMTAGAFLSGRVAAHGLMRGIFVSLAAIAVVLALFGFAAHHQVTAVLAVFLLGAVPTILVPMLQTRLMDVAHEGQSLAAALNHSTLNLANALGAWLGSVVLSAGYGYEWPSRRRCGPGRGRAPHRGVVGAAGSPAARRPGLSESPPPAPARRLPCPDGAGSGHAANGNRGACHTARGLSIAPRSRQRHRTSARPRGWPPPCSGRVSRPRPWGRSPAACARRA